MFRRLFQADRNAKPARLLGRLAGIPAGLRQSRRGSFLIMVVGTLALLSVITVIYVSIGRSDRRTSAAVLKFDQRKDAPAVVRDHIAGIIGDDVFDTLFLGEYTVDPDTDQPVPLFRREAWDYPSAAYRPKAYYNGNEYNTPQSTNQHAVTTAGIDADPAAFDPFQFTPTGNYTGTDPWLAPNEPVLLNINPSRTPYASETDPSAYPYERLDWMNVSNIAPDGAFVNLANLRGPTRNNVSVGNFDATPWEMRGDVLDQDSVGATVTLFAGAPDRDGGRNGQRDFGGQPTDPLAAGGQATPADWSARQRWLAFPALDPRLPPSDPRYMPYQYADADGDGIYDSRWVELVEDRASNDTTAASYVLPPENDIRYFVAARIVDLAGRVNINTATDSTLAPLDTDLAGLTPAGTDIRRLLTLEDFYTDRHLGAAYEGMVAPVRPANDPDSDYAGYDAGNAYYAGEKAYDALRMVLDTGALPPERGLAGLTMLAGGGSVEREFSDLPGGTNLNPYWASYPKLNFQEFGPTDYYETTGGFGPRGGSGHQSAGQFRSGLLGRPFGLDSLAELLTYNGINDDRVRSPLEAALGGRGDPNAMGALLASRFSPLRDSRATDLVERRRGQWRGNRYEFYDQAKLGMYVDARQRLTTHGGTRPILSTAIPARLNEDAPDPGLLSLTAELDVKRGLETLFPEPADNSNTSEDHLLPLYGLYADALAPYAENQTSPNNHWSDSPLETDTLYYGYRGPMLAIRTAAHLAVNMYDSYDDDNLPTKRTVLLDGSPQFRRDLAQDQAMQDAFPWRNLDLDAVSRASSIEKLWRDDNTFPAGSPRAVNVFGVEAQPFLTEVASFIVYTDAPRNADDPGDRDDWPLDFGGRPRNPPTIDGDADPDNPDFLFEMLAFQVHNPFTETVQLSGDDLDGDIERTRRGMFYIRYGEHDFKLVNASYTYDEGNDQYTADGQTAITLEPGETKTFYVLSQPVESIARRVFSITRQTDYGQAVDWQTEKTRVERWIERRLNYHGLYYGENFDPPLQLLPFNVSSGAVGFGDVDDNFTDLQEVDPNDPADEQIRKRRVVELRRVEFPHLESDKRGSLLERSGTNSDANDTIVDRLRDPRFGDTGDTAVTLDRRPFNENRYVRDSTPGFEPQNGSFNGDNEGMTLTRFASIRRRSDPNSDPGSGQEVPRGGLPAYCLELKGQSPPGDGEPDNRNVVYDDGVNLADLHQIHKREVDRWGADTLDEFFSASQGVLSEMVPTIKVEPREKWRFRRTTGGDVQAEPLNANRSQRPFEGGSSTGLYYPPLYVEPNLSNFEFRADLNGDDIPNADEPFLMRTGDLLLPLGIGSFHIPNPGAGAPDTDAEWTTLSEVLAIALNYEFDDDGGYQNAFQQPVGATGPDNSFLDRGHLRFDWFVPFYDLDNDREYDTNEPRWGLAVPLAAQIFDALSPLDPKFASLNAPTHGLLNINTASREVLRSISMLSPPGETDPYTSTPNWWWTQGSNPSQHNWDSDIATVMAAYRDRVTLFTRDPTGNQPTGVPINYRDWFDDPYDPWNSARTFPVQGAPPEENPADSGRWGSTGVMGLRSQPGFRSLGEIAFLRAFGYDDGGFAYHDIDRHAYDDLDLDIDGLDSITPEYPIDGGNGQTEPGDDEIRDDYGERLALPNAVMGSTSIRSDVFAVWFILHGYRESDVKGLAPQDALVPSVARRFLMVVDRSNVVSPGDKPEILLFREVPL